MEHVHKYNSGYAASVESKWRKSSNRSEVIMQQFNCFMTFINAKIFFLR